MTPDEVLSRLQGVRQNQPGDWTACCPAHDDKNASLHITRLDSGKLLFHCFAGCSQEAVIRAIGLTWSDMPGAQPRQRYYGCTLKEYADYKRIPLQTLQSFGLKDGEHTTRATGKTHPCVLIPYFDADGRLTRTRKRMMIRKETSPDGPKRFLWDQHPGFGLSLYGLWRQPQERSSVILVEGESDCHTLWAAGYPALGMPGVSNFNPLRDDPVLAQYGSPDKPSVFVHIEPDCGGFNLFRRLTGEDGCNKGSHQLDRMLFFSLPGYKDPSDAWMALADRPEEFRALMTNALTNARDWQHFPRPAAWAPLEKAEEAKRQQKARQAGKPAQASSEDGEEEPRAPRGRRAADYTGAAAAFLQNYLHKKLPALRFWRQSWYLFDGHSYAQMMDSDLEGQLVAFLQGPDVQEQFALQPTMGAVRNAAMNLRSANFCWIPQELEAPSWIHDHSSARGWVPTANCVVDIETAARVHLEEETHGGVPSKELASTYTRPCTADLLATYAMPYPYDPGATCPKFMTWLSTTQPDPAMQEAIQMLMGLCLVPDTSFNVCFFLFGDAGTGKTTFLRILEAVVGKENCCHVPLLKFAERFQTWPLAEKLVNIVGELPSDDPQGRLRYIEGDFKDSISGEPIDCERKGRDVCKARCIARHVFATNTLPKFFDKSEGIWDRLRILPFLQRFRGTGSQVKNIEETFLPSELPGIFNFALRGLGKLRQHTTFPETETMLRAKTEHQMNCDPDKDYLLTNYERQEGAFLPLSQAYDHYKSFLLDNGFRLRSSTSFAAAILSAFGIRVSRLSDQEGRTRGFRNLAKKFPTPQDEPQQETPPF